MADDNPNVRVIPASSMMLLPPAKHLCQECAHEHTPDLPHNQQSMFYQVKFQKEHGRSATWEDAMAHCSDKMKQDWRRVMLEEHDMVVSDLTDEEILKAHAELMVQLEEAKNLEDT